ncbi:MAG: hypothetical protein AAF335_02935 [Bacteroidota bacterium]
MSLFELHIRSFHLRKKAYIWVVFTFFLPTTKAKPPEVIYGIEVYSKKPQQEYVLGISSYATWRELKEAMRRKEGIELKDNFLFAGYLWGGIPRGKKKKITAKLMDVELYKVIGKYSPINREITYFDTYGYEDMKKETKFQIAKKASKKVRKIHKSNTAHRSLFVCNEDGDFALMSIDDYHNLRKKNNKPRYKKPKERLKKIKNNHKEKKNDDDDNDEDEPKDSFEDIEDDDKATLPVKEEDPSYPFLYALAFSMLFQFKPLVTSSLSYKETEEVSKADRPSPNIKKKKNRNKSTPDYAPDTIMLEN